jgi:hypothetical protein
MVLWSIIVVAIVAGNFFCVLPRCFFFLQVFNLCFYCIVFTLSLPQQAPLWHKLIWGDCGACLKEFSRFYFLSESLRVRGV